MGVLIYYYFFLMFNAYRVDGRTTKKLCYVCCVCARIDLCARSMLS